MRARNGIVVAIIAAASSTARAQESDMNQPTMSRSDVLTAARDGSFLPSTLTARVGAVPALVSATSGYDTAHAAAIATTTVEVHLWGPIALRGGAEYSQARKQARPTIGGRVQLLRQERHGVDGTLGVFYRAEGFTEPEGEIETFVSLGRQFDRIAVVGNLVYGQDPEGSERDGELRLGSLTAAGRWVFGVDSRLRFAIGPQKSPMARTEPKLDALAAPIAMTTVGRLVFYAEAGPTLLKVTNATSVGVAGLGGIGSVF